jgi:hypothetical protein
MILLVMSNLSHNEWLYDHVCFKDVDLQMRRKIIQQI